MASKEVPSITMQEQELRDDGLGPAGIEGKTPIGEDQPLLPTLHNGQAANTERRQEGKASSAGTVMTIAKGCMGMGTLTLPFAAREGGVFLTTVGLLIIACWTLYSMQRLCNCLPLLPESRRVDPPAGTGTFSRVAMHAMGNTGT